MWKYCATFVSVTWNFSGKQETMSQPASCTDVGKQTLMKFVTPDLFCFLPDCILLGFQIRIGIHKLVLKRPSLSLFSWASCHHGKLGDVSFGVLGLASTRFSSNQHSIDLFVLLHVGVGTFSNSQGGASILFFPRQIFHLLWLQRVQHLQGLTITTNRLE